jgi:formylglycine-generating enzyme required for sulfatase activity
VTPDPSPVAGLDLSALVERLRLAGFRVDTRQYLTAHELLLALAAGGTPPSNEPETLAARLGPIFCTSPEEQAKFLDEVRRWRKGAPGAPGVTPRPKPAPPPFPQPLEREPFERWRRARWWQRAVLVLAPIAIVATALTAWYYVPITIPGRVQLQLSSGELVPPSPALPVRLQRDGSVFTMNGDGAFALKVARARAVTLRATLAGFQPVTRHVTGSTPEEAQITLMPEVARRPEPPGPVSTVTQPDPVGVVLAGESSGRAIRWDWVAASTFATAVLAYLFLRTWDRLRRRLALRQLPLHGEPEMVTLGVPPTPILPAAEADLNRVAVALRRPREGSILDLDVPQTVDVTARSGGFFEPRFSARRSMPEYVALVSRRRAEDHQARVFDVLLTHFSAEDVVVDTYSFGEDPRVCVSVATGQAFSLHDVLERHHRATLVVCGETSCAFNRVTGRLLPWVETIPAHVDRIFLTTEAPDRWTDREFELERAGFTVLPANDAGWRVLADPDGRPAAERLFPAPYTRGFPALIGSDELRWLDRNDPPSETVARLLKELKGFLGADGFMWMSACAVYPEISWALSLRVRGDAPAAALPSLGRLPWFRHAFMPRWLRVALIASIPLAFEQRLRRELETLLEDLSRRPTPSGAGSRLQIGRWIGPMDLLTAQVSGSPLQDQVFLGFMTGAHHPLSFRVTRALAGLFKKSPEAFADDRADETTKRPFVSRLIGHLRWWSVLNRRTAHAAAAAAIAAIALVPFTRLLAVAEVTGSNEEIWFIEIPRGPTMIGAPPNTIVVNLREFFIGRTEVTVAQYQACVNAGACTRGKEAAGEAPDWPVNDVNWDEAMQFCRWLDARLRADTNATGAIADALQARRGDGIRWEVTLPTGPEWEKAATSGDGRQYPWGNTLDAARANDQDARILRRTAVGSFPRGASPYGALDMAGNVQEWTRTARTQRPEGDRSDAGAVYPDVTSETRRAIRGGAFDSPMDTLRASTFYLADAKTRSTDIGFRVAIAPVSAPPLPPVQQRRSLAREPAPSPTPQPR